MGFWSSSVMLTSVIPEDDFDESQKSNQYTNRLITYGSYHYLILVLSSCFFVWILPISYHKQNSSKAVSCKPNLAVQDNAAGSLFRPNDESDDQEGELEVTTTATDPCLASKPFLYKAARDQYFGDMLYEKDKNRWSATYLLCKKVKTVFD
ncbi:unnamed protein product [Adineta ricciae]|uniref:Uncharacterized protein n=1 Tax=Adineta ricciae TaxID=249248 RepID=A0A813WVM0_ADIRI|nr:unnamed protein product [Adineta ricciae]CAF0902759.1 unnamed protein product [Adineta ricciae]